MVEFRRQPAENVAWVCLCGCTVHYHHADSRVTCGACDALASEMTGEWLSRLPVVPADPPETNHRHFKVIDLSSAETFLNRQSKPDRPVAAIVVLFTDGAYSTWAGQVENDDQKAWARRKLDEAGRRMTGEALGREA